MNEVASMAAILVTFVTVIFFFFQKKKKISGYKESLFVLNHLIHIFSIYMFDTCIIYIYMITLFWRGPSVRLIRLEKR